MKLETSEQKHKIAGLCADLTMLKFFPSDDEARLGIVLMIGRMAEKEEQVRWLVQRVLALYNEWPGPGEVRAVYCSRFRPEDGITAYSTVYRPHPIGSAPRPRHFRTCQQIM